MADPTASLEFVELGHGLGRGGEMLVVEIAVVLDRTLRVLNPIVPEEAGAIRFEVRRNDSAADVPR